MRFLGFLLVQAVLYVFLWCSQGFFYPTLTFLELNKSIRQQRLSARVKDSVLRTDTERKTAGVGQCRSNRTTYGPNMDSGPELVAQCNLHHWNLHVTQFISLLCSFKAFKKLKNYSFLRSQKNCLSIDMNSSSLGKGLTFVTLNCAHQREDYSFELWIIKLRPDLTYCRHSQISTIKRCNM